MPNGEFEELQKQLQGVSFDKPATPPPPPPPPSCQLTCPNCRREIEILEKLVGSVLGTVVECTLCGHVFRASRRGENKLRVRMEREARAARQLKERCEQAARLRDTVEPQLTRPAPPDMMLNTTGQQGMHHPGKTAIDHTWPYDHHRHPGGMHIRRYVSLWLVAALCALLSWGIYVPLLFLVGGDSASSPPLLTRVWFFVACACSAVAILWFEGLVGAIVSHGKGRPKKEGFLFGLVFGPLGWLLAGLMPNHPGTGDA